MTTTSLMTRDREAYIVDLSDAETVYKFPEDFADWLMDHSRDKDARDFLRRASHYVAITDPEDYDLSDFLTMAREYAPVTDAAELVGHGSPYSSVVELLQDLEEDDEPWDREEAMEMQSDNDSNSSPRDLADPEYPWISIPAYEGDEMPDLVVRAVAALFLDGETHGAHELILGYKYLIRHSLLNEDIYWLVHSFVRIVPEQKHSHFRSKKTGRIRARM